MPPSWFILDRGNQPQQAIDICHGMAMGPPCQVMQQCGDRARNEGLVGVFGGEYFSSRDTDTSIDITDIRPFVVLDDVRPKRAGPED
jgi:hypothetical protein